MWPILISFGPRLHVATYGVLVAASYLVGILWLKRRRESMGLSEDAFWGLIYAVFFGAIGGGKLLYVVLNWPEYTSGRIGWISGLRFGFVFFGGLAGAILAGLFYTWRTGRSFTQLSDYFGVALPMGHAVGRLACLAAGCCYGRPTSVFWGVRFTDPRSLVPEQLLGVKLHPTQLYEAVLNVAIAGALSRLLARVEAGRAPRGCVFGGYVLLYSFGRFYVETFRGDYRGAAVGGLSPSQAIGVAGVVAGIVLLARSFKAAPGGESGR